MPPPTIGQTMSFHPPIIFYSTTLITITTTIIISKEEEVNKTEATARWTLILFLQACPLYLLGYPRPLRGDLGAYPHRRLLDQHLKRLFQVKYFNVHKRCKSI